MKTNIKDTGPNQHYIPQMLLRGFGRLRKKRGRRKIYDVLVCLKDRKYKSATDGVGAENYFYSAKGDPTGLDTLITEYESTILSKDLAKLRSYAENERVDSDIASAVIAHLALRTAHLRKGLTVGTKRLVTKLATETDISKLLSQQYGFDKGIPSVSFIESITEFLDNNDYPFKHPMPHDVIVKALFFYLRENKNTPLMDANALFHSFFAFLLADLERQIESGHKKALLSSQAPQVHIDYLRGFSWAMQKGPESGAILPDCVVIAIANDGTPSPYVFREQEIDKFIILPIDSERLLIGSKGSEAFSQDYNTLAAQTCDLFFVCSPQVSGTCTLQNVMSQSSRKVLFESVDSAVKNCLKTDDMGVSFSFERKHAEKLSVNFLHGFDKEDAEKAAHNIYDIILKVGKSASTDSIRGIIFTNTNFSDAVKVISSFKLPDEHILKKEDSLRDNKITFQIIRFEDEALQYFIVGNYEIAHALSKNDAAQDALIYDFACYVASLSIINNSCSPLKENTSENLPFEGFLYTVFEAYWGTRIAGSIVHIDKQSLFLAVMNRYDELIYKLRHERIELETHKNCALFLEKTTDLVTFFLRNLAAFYGHLHAGNHEMMPQANMIEDKLKENGLDNWVLCYEEDLRRLFDCFVGTGNVDSLEVLNNHFERVFVSASFFLTKKETEYYGLPLPLDAFTPLTV